MVNPKRFNSIKWIGSIRFVFFSSSLTEKRKSWFLKIAAYISSGKTNSFRAPQALYLEKIKQSIQTRDELHDVTYIFVLPPFISTKSNSVSTLILAQFAFTVLRWIIGQQCAPKREKAKVQNFGTQITFQILLVRSTQHALAWRAISDGLLWRKSLRTFWEAN